MRLDWLTLTTTMSAWGHSAWEAHFNRHCHRRRVRVPSNSRQVLKRYRLIVLIPSLSHSSGSRIVVVFCATVLGFHTSL
jgi:hypothetical protein